MLKIRPAEPEDAALVYAFVRELADYERLSHEVAASEADIAEWGGAPAGFALWFYNFTTFRGRCGLYLEDLYVRPEHRGKGIGKALLSHLARRCAREGLPRMQWAVLDWNAPSIAFYERLGARPNADWIVYRLTGAALSELAARNPQEPSCSS